jgi:protein transport protein SEC31
VTKSFGIREVEGDALVSRVQKHKGPVRGLDFNIFKPNLLASGATESEVCN